MLHGFSFMCIMLVLNNKREREMKFNIGDEVLVDKKPMVFSWDMVGENPQSVTTVPKGLASCLGIIIDDRAEICPVSGDVIGTNYMVEGLFATYWVGEDWLVKINAEV